jgi:alkylhydroperoxidase family enzyme
VAKLLHEIEWENPLLAPQPNTVYEAELAKRLSPWIAAATRSFSEPEKVAFAPLKLMGVAYFVASHENACRYCYGESRALMKIWGYSEKQIQDLEHEANLAGGLTRNVVEFARKLAKSNPSPARKDSEVLLQEGLSLEAVSEIAACVVKACFANRLATFFALPPNEAFEKLSNSPIGRIFGAFYRKKLVPRKAPPPDDFRNEGPFAEIIAEAGTTPIAAWLRTLTDGWLASQVIPNRDKFLMLAVIARQLGSHLCEGEARRILAGEGFYERDVDAILSTLSSPALTSLETILIRWIRETVWYEPRIIQNSTRKLLADAGEEKTIEAIGTAAICNTLARLSLVRQ